MVSKLSQRWRKNGKIFVWRCDDGHWNVSADENGCQSLIELFSEMEKEPWSTRVEFAVDKSFRVANADKFGFKNARRMRLSYLPGEINRNHWKLHFVGNEELACEFGWNLLASFKQGILDCADGKGDYGIGDDGHRLWIWWSLPYQGKEKI